MVYSVRDAKRARLLTPGGLSKMVTLKKVHNHPPVPHYIKTFSLNKAKKILGNVIIPERSRWSTHIEGDIYWIDFVK